MRIPEHAPAKVVDIELTEPFRALERLEGYRGVQGLVRINGAPIGQVSAPVSDGRCPEGVLFAPISRFHRLAVARELLYQALSRPLPPGGLELPALLEDRGGSMEGAGRSREKARAGSAASTSGEGAFPRVTVAVCSRERPADLKRCLESLLRLEYQNLDLLVIDNAPRSDVTRQLVRFCFPTVRYVHEPRPGLNWARNRAVHEARGEIIAFTDDDAVVDSGWVGAFARLFRETPEVMAATGLVVPYELETEAQLLFEHFGSFGQGFSRRWGKVDIDAGERVAARFGATGAFGTGANMAFRRSIFSRVGLFDPALDAGTATQGGGDLEMFFRIIKEGYTLVREPRAVIRHRHRTEYEELRRQVATWGTGLYSHVLKSWEAYPDERAGFLWMTFSWMGLRLPRRLAKCLWEQRFPYELLLDEARGIFLAPSRFREARFAAERTEALMGGIPIPSEAGLGSRTDHPVGAGAEHTPNPHQDAWPGGVEAPTIQAHGGWEGGRHTSATTWGPTRRQGRRLYPEKTLSWAIDLGEELPEVIEAGNARRLEIDIHWNGRSLGSLVVTPAGRPVRAAELRDAIADALAPGAPPLFRDLGTPTAGICLPALLRRP